MRRLLRPLLALLLCITLMPGWVEVLENLEHLVHDGHLAHAGDHGAHAGHEHEDVAVHEALEAEHGCTPIRHTCACHTSLPAILPDAPALAALATPRAEARPPELQTRLVHRANAPPVRPPIHA